MKKINFRKVSSALSVKEMKNVLGGSNAYVCNVDGEHVCGARCTSDADCRPHGSNAKCNARWC